jgi:hypothetical protein
MAMAYTGGARATHFTGRQDYADRGGLEAPLICVGEKVDICYVPISNLPGELLIIGCLSNRTQVKPLFDPHPFSFQS